MLAGLHRCGGPHMLCLLCPACLPCRGGHGSMVAGILAARTGNSKGVAGLAYQVGQMPRALDCAARALPRPLAWRQLTSLSLLLSSEALDPDPLHAFTGTPIRPLPPSAPSTPLLRSRLPQAPLLVCRIYNVTNGTYTGGYTSSIDLCVSLCIAVSTGRLPLAFVFHSSCDGPCNFAHLFPPRSLQEGAKVLPAYFF